MKKNSITSLLLLLCAFCCSPMSAQRHFILQNSDDGESELHCFLPQYPSGRAIIDCPGGAYGGLAFDKEGTDWAEFFNKQGIAYFTLKYRMPKGNPDIPLTDAQNAVRLVRDSAKVWHINRQDVGIMGFSAGGHLAAMVSTMAPFDARPDFSILVYPVINASERWGHSGTSRRLLGDKRTDSLTLARYTLDNLVNHYATPPALILLSNDDRTVPPYTNGVAYYTAMRKAGNDCTMHIYQKGGHGYGYKSSFPYHREMLDDITTWLNDHPAHKENAIKVACIGNSITRGACIDMASQFSYPAQMQKILGDGFYVRNFGMSGYNMINSTHLPYMKSGAWTMALGFNPDIVVIKLGTNDARADVWVDREKEFEQDTQRMIDSLRALPSHPRIILCTPIPIKSHKLVSDTTLVEDLIPRLLKVAKKNKVEVLDLHSLYTDMSTYFVDGLHPNVHGAKIIATHVANAILAPVKESAPKKK